VVGSYPPNAFGLYDMHGNVREWVEDWYDLYPLGEVTDPLGTPGSPGRVIRGGSFGRGAASCRAAYRLCRAPEYRNVDQGFRLARVFSG
jgi:formylglycine-generating enzyme required for sulfatase activity